MIRISHLDRKTNVEVLKMAKAKQTLLRKLQYFGNLIQGKGKQILLMNGKIEESRRRGKQRIWTSDVMDWCSLSIREVLQWQNIERNGVS